MLRQYLSIIILFATVFCTAADPHLEIIPDATVDLGDILEDMETSRELYIKNTGDEPLKIQKFFTSCTCTSVKFDNKEIAPGDSLPMTVTFSAKGRRPGSVRKVLRITSNADNYIVSLLVKGEIISSNTK